MLLLRIYCMSAAAVQLNSAAVHDGCMLQLPSVLRLHVLAYAFSNALNAHHSTTNYKGHSGVDTLLGMLSQRCDLPVALCTCDLHLHAFLHQLLLSSLSAL
jgi:hypothetical protein